MDSNAFHLFSIIVKYFSGNIVKVDVWNRFSTVTKKIYHINEKMENFYRLLKLHANALKFHALIINEHNFIFVQKFSVISGEMNDRRR